MSEVLDRTQLAAQRDLVEFSLVPLDFQGGQLPCWQVQVGEDGVGR